VWLFKDRVWLFKVKESRLKNDLNPVLSFVTLYELAHFLLSRNHIYTMFLRFDSVNHLWNDLEQNFDALLKKFAVQTSPTSEALTLMGILKIINL
jgi:hypothetical protein